MEKKHRIKKERNKIERFFNRYNHIMEFLRTIFAIIMIILQIFIITHLLLR